MDKKQIAQNEKSLLNIRKLAQLRMFAMIVYNNYFPRNVEKMEANLEFVVKALEAMGSD